MSGPRSPRFDHTARSGPRALLSAVLASGLVIVVSLLTASPADAAEPKVAIIVGPAGAATDAYRADGERAAAEARRFTSAVVTVVSPDATWPAARAAMEGASIVVYLGHGNGWPSPHSDSLRPATQDGLGLNPVAGVDDVAHQYFGEAYLASSVHLAPHAVVLLHHLCYASGESEAGLPPASVDVAALRVDNYAAGWLRAGAEAVVADASSVGPAWYVRSILSGAGSIEGIWRAAPSFHDHVVAFASIRTPGMSGLLDPTRPDSRFYRSLVARTTLRADEVARGGARLDRSALPVPPGPTAGPTVTAVRLSGSAVTGTSVTLTATLAAATTDHLVLGARWDRLALEPTEAPVGHPAPTPAGSPTTSPPGAGTPLSSPGPGAIGPVELVTPEVPGSLVKVLDTRAAGASLRAAIDAPVAPGLYRLVVTLHDRAGVAFDAATQERIPALIVRVSAALSAVIAAPRSLVLEAGDTVPVAVAVTNPGRIGWTAPGPPDTAGGRAEPSTESSALLVGHWLRLDLGARIATPSDVVATVRAEPGETSQVVLELVAPLDHGDYQLVLDIVSPVYGSLSAAGMPPVAIPVRVEPVTVAVDPRETR
jgi:hypothetical protein